MDLKRQRFSALAPLAVLQCKPATIEVEIFIKIVKFFRGVAKLSFITAVWNFVLCDASAQSLATTAIE
jgi:hypothetical protein